MKILDSKLEIEKNDCVFVASVSDESWEFPIVVCSGTDNWEFQPSAGMGMTILISQHLFDLPGSLVLHTQDNEHYKGGNCLSSNHIINLKGEAIHSWVSERKTDFIIAQGLLYYLREGSGETDRVYLCVYDLERMRLKEHIVCFGFMKEEYSAQLESRHLVVDDREGFLSLSYSTGVFNRVPISAIVRGETQTIMRVLYMDTISRRPKSESVSQQREEESHWFALAFTAIMNLLDGTTETKIEAYTDALAKLSLENIREKKGISAIINQNTFRVREEKLTPLIATLPWERRVALGRALADMTKSGSLIRDRVFMRLLHFSSELKIDIESIGLAPQDLAGANLRRLTLAGIELSNISLRGADLSGADLRNAKIIGCNLADANLTRTILNGATISQSDLQNANLERASVSDTSILSCNLMGANVQCVRLNRIKALDLNCFPSFSPLMSLPSSLWFHKIHRRRRSYHLKRTNNLPDRSTESYINYTGTRACPFPLNESGNFIAMINVEPIRADMPWLVEVEAIAVFQTDSKSGTAIPITREQADALDVFDPEGLSQLTLESGVWEDVAEEWMRALGIRHVKIIAENIPYEGTKLGGHYAPVQQKRLKNVLGETVRRAALLCQLDLDDCARLPGSGLLYVFTHPDDEGRAVFVVHCE